MADQIRIPITVCHYPPGTSKWNKIEHRLFSFISLNWRGEPLISYETIINPIGGTKTRTGLKVKALLDTNQYETGIKCPTNNSERYGYASTEFIRRGTTRSRLAKARNHKPIVHIIS